MSLHDDMKARLSELRANIDGKIEKRGSVLDAALTESRGLTDTEQASHDGLTAEITELRTREPLMEQRVAELAESERREALAAKARVEAGATGEQRTSGGAKVKDAPVYARGNHQVSYFRDMVSSRYEQSSEATERLRRSGLMAGFESRALGNTNTTGGSGGEFAPPEWMVDEWVKLARPGRVIADLYHREDVPVGKSSINLPKILTGTSVALQSTQNTALAQTDITTSFVSTGFATIGGKQIVSQQLLDQSEINFDAVILSDLAAAWTTQLATLMWTGAGTGANNNSVINGLVNATVPAGNQITYTSAAPTAALLYSKAAGALAAFAANRFANPTHWLMSPRRWFYLLAASDSQGRPLVVPSAVAYNPIATTDNPANVSGPVGMFLGLPVVIDPLMPTNFGTGLNQDRVYLIKSDDLWLYESAPRSESFRETYSDSLGVLYRMFSYVGTLLNRQGASIAYIDGTGLVAPSF